MKLIKLQFFLSLFLLCLPLKAYASTQPVVLVASYDGAITPAAEEWLGSALRVAHEKNVSCLIIELDTPGGLLESTRILVKEISASSIPVVVYVSPQGARAASAGTFITLAAHIASMAPQTRIGAAHPVELGKTTEGDMRAKIENDTVAFIKTIAESRKRNSKWAEDAVRKSSSATEQEALQLGVIDLIAKDLDELIERIHGKVVETSSGKKGLITKGAKKEIFPMSLRVKILKTITDPNIAYLLMMIGIYGILYELMNPGAVLPGVAGAISLLLGLYSLQTLPINYAGAGLIVLAVVLFVIESQIPSGLAGLGGVIALALGSLMLVRVEFPYWQISRPLIFSTVILTALLLFILIVLLLRIRKTKVVSGVEGMIGQTATAKTNLSPLGQVIYGGEIWNAESLETILEGEEVEIMQVVKLKLIVKRKK
ncbi:MAG: hypothetical protein A3I11_05900 [Elusimicrobia bacterium RIFCSPLOWO2_02_FULL_39_32]|nr:MAG: hypothetical protein A2034_04230 [Elusimicrobia bacterium GWA2_38_7]OGR80670.1 MAG: hypothetical protein A3B80_04080 [Elusimicrobia bacterium RIFCSPHIGHO2_02_FULL_39_36]OGR91518.1 MAG: hypothetical protein A3I11_05900 [Elusimicrobia bacterium RIFCSPLOWO2_02_FULL_39_32]OGS00773.1 MAG: hypothetical protein A3G85_04500 [Elusimicrobia bacterium RIFCSPLOWO2_12_FULL_39_28]